MKRVISAVLVLALITSISGCKPSQYISEDQESYDQAIEILRCLNEEDMEGLKRLFCERVASTHDLDEEITVSMDFYQGRSVSYSNILVGGGSSRRDGEYVDFHLGYWITAIETTDNKSYDMDTHSYLIYRDESDLVGITYLNIYDTEAEESVEIGEYVM